MCLILLAWRVHPDYPLVVAANRDEFFTRPTAPAGFWSDASEVFAGRDLEAGGTWLGATRGGRFAALTNYRDPARNRNGAPSRGELVSAFLRGNATPADYIARLQPRSGAYNGFNLLAGDGHDMHYFSNVAEESGHIGPLAPNVYGLSNHLLDTPWPKVARGKSALTAALDALPDAEPLFELLRDDCQAADEELPRTGVSLEWERLLSAAFIRSPAYGTRSSTVVLRDTAGNTTFIEQTWDRDGGPAGRVQKSF
ncbi:MAG: NRDE family protein [Pseudomonadota bacterium]